MTELKTKDPTAAVLASLYKFLDMGSGVLLNLISRTKDEGLRNQLTRQLAGYEAESLQIKKKLDERGQEEEKEGFMSKTMAKMGTIMNTAIDATSSHIAEMVIEGSTMNITQITKLIREYENTSCSEDCLTLARRIVSFEEKNIEDLKAFL